MKNKSLIINRFLSTVIMACILNFGYSQIVEIDGSLKVLQVDTVVNVGTEVVRLADGTLAVEEVNNTARHYVGELWGGGLVYHVYNNGQNGLIVSPDNLATINGLTWHGSAGFVLTGAQSYGDGASNTDTIVSVLGAGNYPAYLCDTLSVNGFTDWYLPSKSEMLHLLGTFYIVESIYANDSDPNTNSLIEDNIDGFSGYWSSSEVNQYEAEYIYFNGPDQGGTKDRPYRVRAIRKF